MALHPIRLDAAIIAQWDFHAMAAVHDFKPAILRAHLTHRDKHSEMFDVLGVGVGICVDMGVNPPIRLDPLKDTYTIVYLPLPASL